MTYSLQRLLVVLGLVCVPFYEIILKALPFVRSVAPDSRAPKEIIDMVFALSIGLLAVFQGTLKPFRNKFLLIIPVYLLISLISSPHSDMFINGVESGDFFFWKPFVEVLCFALMIFAVASMEINYDDILNTMVICGAIMAGYVVLQKLGFDQFWITRPTPENIGFTPYNEIGGNLGQSTIVASFIVMIIPLALYLKKYLMSILMVIAVLITQSDMAYLSLIVILLVSLMYRKRFLIIPTLSILFILISVLSSIYAQDSNLRAQISKHMSGRVVVWSNIYEDIKYGAIEGSKQDFSITGVGFGRFPFIFPDKHKSEFSQAHNDPLEFTYNCGLIGLSLLILGLFSITIKPILSGFRTFSPLHFSVFLSFAVIFFCSIGGFPFQLGAHQFYSAILVGLLHNRGVLNGA